MGYRHPVARWSLLLVVSLALHHFKGSVTPSMPLLTSSTALTNFQALHHPYGPRLFITPMANSMRLTISV